MAQHALTDQVGVRFGIGGALLFLVTAVDVYCGLSGTYGVAILLIATTVLAAPLDAPHGLLLGLAGWAFATGFAVNTLGVLTLAPLDVLRLVLFVVVAVVVGRHGDAA